MIETQQSRAKFNKDRVSQGLTPINGVVTVQASKLAGDTTTETLAEDELCPRCKAIIRARTAKSRRKR